MDDLKINFSDISEKWCISLLFGKLLVEIHKYCEEENYEIYTRNI